MTADLSLAAWRKSSRSTENGGQCVEVAAAEGWAAIRDSKNPTGGALVLSSPAWAGFRTAVKSQDAR